MSETYLEKREKKRCAYCGNVFTPITVRGRFCSPECARKGVCKEQLQKRLKKRMQDALENPRLCVVCGNPIPVKEGGRSTKKTCSLACSKALAVRRASKSRAMRKSREAAVKAAENMKEE